jgi:hypothetical protein
MLTLEKKCRVVAALVDGVSIRATGRMCDHHRDTVMLHGMEIGEACRRLHNVLMQALQVDVLEFDEIWGFIGKKQRRVRPLDPIDFGDQYTFIGLDANRKAIVSYLVAKRTAEAATAFAEDTRRRIMGSPQITTDGFPGYPGAIAAAFGKGADYSMIIKEYGDPAQNRGDDIRYSRSKCTKSEKVPVSGTPDPSRISTSYVERQNLTMRMGVRRQTRLSNAFSKKLRNHAAAIALYAAHYNFVRVHETLKTTPAVALGVADHPWSIGELIESALSIAPEQPLPQIRPVLLAPRPDRQLDLFERPQPMASVSTEPLPEYGAQLSFFVA